jgi:hypothetical protein
LAEEIIKTKISETDLINIDFNQEKQEITISITNDPVEKETGSDPLEKIS